MTEVWTDGNGAGFYSYLAESGQGTVGRIEPVFRNKGRNLTRAEAQAILAALENTDADALKINTDSTAIYGMIRRPGIALRPRNEAVRPTVGRIRVLLELRRAELRLIRGAQNRARTLLIPYRNHPRHRVRGAPTARPQAVHRAVEPVGSALEVWTDGNGHGYYSYCAVDGSRGVGRLPQPVKRGKMTMIAEARAIVAALDAVRGEGLVVYSDSQPVVQMIANPQLILKQRNAFMRPLIGEILARAAERSVRFVNIRRCENRADRLLAPYGRKYAVRDLMHGNPPPGGDQ